MLVRGSLAGVVFGLVAFGLPSMSAYQADAPNSLLVTVYTPSMQQFELALDQAELEWVNAGPGKQVLAAGVVAVEGTRVARRLGARTAFAVVDAHTPGELVARVKALEFANPGSQGELVLYERGRGRSDPTRHVLTKQIGVVLKDPTDPDDVLKRFAATTPQTIPGVPGGYVITADDPLAAVAIAGLLRQEPGVASASPLMRHARFAR